MKSISQRRRAQLGLLTVVVTNVGVYIWSIIMQVKFNASHPGAIDWDDALYPSSFLPYFFVQTTGPMSQSYMYWLLSSFATDAQGMTIYHEINIIRSITDIIPANVRNGAAFRYVNSDKLFYRRETNRSAVVWKP